jgi:hypothetical protein
VCPACHRGPIHGRNEIGFKHGGKWYTIKQARAIPDDWNAEYDAIEEASK